MAGQYTINCNYGHSERDADYATRDRVVLPWEPCDPFEGQHGLCGNVSVVWDGDTPRFQSLGEWDSKATPMYQRIPSALLMYRIACTFTGTIPIMGREGYKSVWYFGLRHTPTGEILMLSEHKGGAGTWTRFRDNEELPEAFAADMLALTGYLCSANCAHPYDGTVAGSVA